MADLKPCPFCGGEATIYKKLYKGQFYLGAMCKNTAFCCTLAPVYIDDNEAIEAWNTRKPEETVVAKLKELEKEKLEMYEWEGQTAVLEAISVVRGKE